MALESRCGATEYFRARLLMMRAHMMRAAFTLLIILAALAGCAKPPPSAQVGAERGEAVAMGKDVAGEECNQQRGGSPDTAYIYCGDWDQPAAHIRNGGPAEPASLQSLATTGPWRTAVDL